MNSPILVVAMKEIREACRDTRALMSSMLYTLMGPVIVGFFAATKGKATTPSEFSTVLAMASVFVLIAGFTGGMNIAMDTLAGERERRSLLPLLLNPVDRLQVVIGKWIAVSTFAVVAVTLNALVVGIVLRVVSPPEFLRNVSGVSFIFLYGSLVALALLASAAELAISTLCRTVKEAHTSLGFLVFIPMLLGMFLSLYARVVGSWCYAVPVIGQKVLMAAVLSGSHVNLSHVVVLISMTCVGTISLLRWTGRLLHKDSVVYGQ